MLFLGTLYLRKENRCALATSGEKRVWPQEKSEFGIAQQFSIQYAHVNPANDVQCCRGILNSKFHSG